MHVCFVCSKVGSHFHSILLRLRRTREWNLKRPSVFGGRLGLYWMLSAFSTSVTHSHTNKLRLISAFRLWPQMRFQIFWAVKSTLITADKKRLETKKWSTLLEITISAAIYPISTQPFVVQQTKMLLNNNRFNKTSFHLWIKRKMYR